MSTPEDAKAAEVKERLARALADKDDSSRQVSTNNRYIAFGLVAVTYSLLTSDAHAATLILNAHPFLVMLVGGIGCLGVLFDYFHYMAATSTATKAINNKFDGHQHQYDRKWWQYRARNFFYWARIVASVAGTLTLIVLIVISWFSIAA